MKYRHIFTTALLIIVSGICQAQGTIKIYHGTRGQSEIIDHGSGIGTHLQKVLKPGTKVTLEVINPHPSLYDYKFQVNNIKEENEQIEGEADLIPLLSSLLGLAPGAEAKKGNDRAGARVAAEDAVDDWQKLYLEQLQALSNEISEAKLIIQRSDQPGTVSNILDKNFAAGFVWATNELKNLSFFTNAGLETEVRQWKTDLGSTAHGFRAGNALDELQREIFAKYGEALLLSAKEIKAAYSDAVPSVIRYSFTVRDTIQEISLSIKNKSESVRGREVGDKVITVAIVPHYKRAKLEFLPIGTLAYTRSALKFSVREGVIVQEEDEQFKFRSGGVLNFNFLNWGERKRYALGAGIGFAIANNDLDNIYGSLMLSYTKWVRIGIGFGAANVPSYLKNGLQVGEALPANIADIEDVIGYRKKPAAFLMFVIPGLNLPLLK